MLRTYQGLFVFISPVCLVVLRKRNKQGAVGWQSLRTRWELPAGLAGSLEWKERACGVTTALQTLLPRSCPGSMGLCAEAGAARAEQPTDSLPGMERGCFNPFLLLQQDFDPSLLWGFVFLLSASGNKQTNEQKNPNPSTSPPKHPKNPSKKPKETKQRKNHFLQVAIQHKLNKQEFRCCWRGSWSLSIEKFSP